jgi:hypothetical protein
MFKQLVVITFAVCAIGAVAFAQGQPENAPASPSLAAQHLGRVSVVENRTDYVNPALAPLAAYVEKIMNVWPHAAPVVATTDYALIAHDVARAVLIDEGKWPEGWTREKRAVLLAGVGYWEGARFARYVDTGECNDADWREGGLESYTVEMRIQGMAIGTEERPISAKKLLKYGDCDHAHAFSLWQIHETSWPFDSYGRLDRDRLGDRQEAAIVALVLLRDSLNRTGTLCDYTGEFAEPCPKAAERLHFAEITFAHHPPQ